MQMRMKANKGVKQNKKSKKRKTVIKRSKLRMGRSLEKRAEKEKMKKNKSKDIINSTNIRI